MVSVSSGYRFLLIPTAHAVVPLHRVPSPFHSFLSRTNWLPTIPTRGRPPRTNCSTIDHLRALAQLNENYASEERCLAAVLDATSAYQDLTSMSLPPANISLCLAFPPLSFCSRNSRRHPSPKHLQPYRALTLDHTHPDPFNSTTSARIRTPPPPPITYTARGTPHNHAALPR